jgi:polysaccharide export outer membrane protein
MKGMIVWLALLASAWPGVAAPTNGVAGGTNSLLADFAPAGSVPHGTSRPYLLSVDDQLLVEVFQETELESKRRVAEDGTITIPLIGRVKVAGRTAQQAGDMIRDELEKGYLVNPRVNVTVVEYSKRCFTVLGQVAKPGPYPMTGVETVTLVQAIAAAGGPTGKGNLSKVTVTRPTVEGNLVYRELDAKAMSRGRTPGQFEVRAGDTITVAERIF